MKRLLALSLSFLFCATASAATGPLYRLDLRDGSRVLSKDQPVHRGSVVLFHAYPRGVLTGLPEEDIVAVSSMAARAPANALTVNAPTALQPGQVLFLGPTAGPGQGAETSTPAFAVAPSIPGGVYDPRNPLYGSYGLGGGGAAVAPGTEGDLARALAGEPPTVETPLGPNGFPVTTPSSLPTIGPNGFPVMTGNGAPQLGSNGFPVTTPASPPTIGPNGFPVMTGTPTLSIGPDGQPILAPAIAPGAAAPMIGPNGTPILAPPGAPGSTPPAVGSNGYPAAPAPKH